MNKTTLSLALTAALLSNAMGTVYLKPLATDEERAIIDGASWATAYTDIGAAIAAATTDGSAIYAAQGVYIVNATITPSGSFSLFGGFPGLSDDETLADRDTERYQTIVTGDQTLNDKWKHVVPTLGQYKAVSTALSDTVIQNGRITLPADFSADYDVFFGEVAGTDTANGFKFSTSGATVVLDGVWFSGFIASGNFGSLCTVSSGSLTMNDCRVVGMKGGTRGVVFASGGTGIFTNTKFLYSTGSENIAIRAATTSLTVSNCVFKCLYRSGANTCGMAFYAQNSAVARDCEFCRILDVTTADGGGYGGMSVISGGDSGTPSFVRCVITNNLGMSSGKYGTPLIARAQLIKDCLIANNRYEVKPRADTGYALIGYASAAKNTYTLCDGTVFRGNVVTAPQTVATSGAFYLGIIGPGLTSSSAGQRFGVVNCVFDSNTVSSVTSDALSPGLCRGPFVTDTGSGSKAQLGVANCTFTGPADGPADIAQYGASYSRDLPVVNCVFTVTGGDVASGRIHAEKPSAVKLLSCTVKNNADAGEGFGTRENLETDDVPLDADYRPLAMTPGLRETADISTNAVVSSGASKFGYRAYGASSWLPLLSVLENVSASAMTKPIGDRFGTSRPFGAFTRGTVQALPPAAETGCTLTIRRSPLLSGTLAGAPNAQSVATGAAISPVTAVPSSADIVFAGWYGTNDVLYSAANPLEIQALTSNLVLVAKFESPRVRLTFDLGAYGVFTANNSPTITVEAGYLDPFPAIPAYSLYPDLHATGWDAMPDAVPRDNATYSIHCVPTSLRTIYVVPEAEAPALQDGTSWATAYTNLATAVADAGSYRGQVLVKTGVYKLFDSIILLPNVAIRGGYAGTEAATDAPDPDAHPVVITGDVNGDDYWLVNGAATAAANRTAIFDGLSYNPPNPTGADHYWISGGNCSDNTGLAFVHTDNAATNISLSGLTIALFARSGFKSSTSSGSGVSFDNCRFIGCNASRIGNDGSSSDYDIGAVNVSGTDVSFSRCVFEGSFWAFRIAGATAVTNHFRDCAFNSNGGSAKACAIRTAGLGVLDMERCRFHRNCSGDEKHESAACLVLGASGLSTFRDCVFEDNRCRSLTGYGAHGLILAYGGNSLFERCSFIGNDMTQSSFYTAAGLIFCGYSSSDSTHLVRDCYFAGNKVNATSSDSVWGSILCSRQGRWTFLNCSFEDNTNAVSRGACSLFNLDTDNTSLALVNCSIRDSVFPNAENPAEIRVRSGAVSLAVINTAIGNESPGYSPFTLASTTSFGIANSTVANYAAPGCSGSNGFEYDVVAAQPVFRPRTCVGPGGLKAVGVGSQSALDGRPVWLVDTTLYYRDETANPSKPWRRANSNSSFAASVAGLDMADVPVSDAFGNARTARHYPRGPLNPNPPQTILFLQ